MARLAGYWRATRAPRYSLPFALPLLVAYEVLAAALASRGGEGIRNGADVLLKSLFGLLGGRHGLLAFGVLLVGGGAWLVARDLRRGGRLEGRVFGLMLLESLAWAVVVGSLSSLLTGLLLQGPRLAADAAPLARLDLPTRVMLSLGAGLYEELCFRVLLVGALAWLASRGFGWRAGAAGAFATLTGALLFSAFHYVGPYGDPWQLGSFTFRAVAGVLFSGLYLQRGFGIAAWTHACYDLMVL